MNNKRKTEKGKRKIILIDRVRVKICVAVLNT